MRAPAVSLVSLALAAGPVAIPAQTPAWNVPHRGAIVFTRTTERQAMRPPPSRVRLEWLVGGADAGGHEWRHRAFGAGGAPAGFEAPGFDDAGWPRGRGEFGPEAGKDPRQRTRWTTAELCLRTRIDLARRKPRAVLLRIDHDDGVRVFCNGRLVHENDGCGRGRDCVLLGPALEAFQAGENLLAVHCRNTGGAQYLDVALALVPSLPPGVRTAEEVLAMLATDREAAARVERDLFGGFRPPAVLTQGELDGAQQRIAQPPGDLRELAHWVATDLSRGPTGGAWQADAWRMYRLGDLLLRGKAGTADAGGWQDLEVAVRNSAEPAPRDDSKRFVDMFVKPHVLYGFDGALRVRRRIELQGGRARVVEYRSELTGRVLRGRDWKEPAAEFEQIESCRLAVVHENQDAAFRAGVAAALKRGTEHLRARLRDLDRAELAAQPADGENSFHGGRLALGLLALIKGGVPRDDAVLGRGLAALRERALIDTYSLGNALMALEALHAPGNELADLRHGVIDRPRQRSLPPADLELARRWTGRLLQNVDTRVDPEVLLRFNYTRGERYDNSVTQYGLLGLYSAHLCGIALPATVWEAAVNHLLAAQGEGRPRFELDLVDYRTLARLQSEPDVRRTASRLPVRPAGWNYDDPREGGEYRPVWGSMTCAGVAGLAICQAALLDQPGQKRFKLQADATAARNAGFGWLAQNLSFRVHPGAIVRQHQWLYYYLYGLERAALLSGVALLQDRDWYFEGALMLVLAQQQNGSWPSELHGDHEIERDAMAILFLKQGTLPVLTGQ
jgi:hypothetical protein